MKSKIFRVDQTFSNFVTPGSQKPKDSRSGCREGRAKYDGNSFSSPTLNSKPFEGKDCITSTLVPPNALYTVDDKLPVKYVMNE